MFSNEKRSHHWNEHYHLDKMVHIELQNILSKDFKKKCEKYRGYMLSSALNINDRKSRISKSQQKIWFFPFNNFLTLFMHVSRLQQRNRITYCFVFICFPRIFHSKQEKPEIQMNFLYDIRLIIIIIENIKAHGPRPTYQNIY